MGQTRPLFVYFRPFLNTMTNIAQYWLYNSVDGLLGIGTRGHRMVGEDGHTELWRPHFRFSYLICFCCRHCTRRRLTFP